jgi:signal transduction histidine kinase
VLTFLSANRRRAAWVAWSVGAASAALLAGASLVSVLGPSPANLEAYSQIPLLAFPIVGAVVASRRPENWIGWIFLGIALSFSVAIFTGEYATYALVDRPGSIPGGGVASWAGTWIWTPAIGLIFTFLLLLFPTGHLPSPRWRAVAWLSGLAMLLGTIPVALTAWPIQGLILVNIEDEAPAAAPLAFKVAYNLQILGILMLFVLGLACAVSVVLRMRRASGDERAQVRWFALAGLFVVVAFILNSPLFNVGGSVLVPVALLLLPVAASIAVLKYRLYDIDVVINKAVVFGALAVFITAVYAGIVAGIGTLIGRRGSVLLSAAAAAVVAVAFQPIRQRAQHLANRLVYGRRATPYEVLSDFSHRVAGSYTTEDILPRIAEIMAAGTGARRAEVWLAVGAELRLAASWPDGAGEERIPLEGSEVTAGVSADRAFPVRDQGELLGVLTVSMPPTDPLTPSQAELVEGLASQAGLVLRNVRLIEDVRASRRRLVAAQDEERRRLERNLHDGAQQQLVALALKVRLAEGLAERDPGKSREMLSEVQSGMQDAMNDLRDLARGIYPPLLADQGLAVALDAQARKAAVPARVEAGEIGRHPQEVEAAVYFCCLEALQNVAKYAGATQASVRLATEEGELRFEVIDDGKGFDPAATPLGSGLQNMVDRLAALGGSVDIRSAPGSGTTVAGRIPVRSEMAFQPPRSGPGLGPPAAIEPGA